MTSPAAVVVNGRGARRARRGHPWIYRDDVLEVRGTAAAGDVVAVLERSGKPCCWAAWSPESRIVLRRVSAREAALDDAYWDAAVGRALARRGAAAAAGRDAARLLHADAEGFPGLTVDRYGEHLVVQATTAWADRAAPGLLARIAQRTGTVSALARNDAPARQFDGLAREVVQLTGTTPAEIEVAIGGVRRLVDPWHGHKTGTYLDQQESQRQVATWLHGTVLDLFTAEGGFALPLAADGCTVTAVDQSAPLLERARRSAESNGLSPRVTFMADNAFDVLTRLDRSGARFDGVILDPPPFARRRDETGGALRGYKDLHRRAARLLVPGGRMLTFSCSFAIGPEEFEAIVREGAEEAGVELRVLGRPGPAADHPEVLAFPESRYLKGLLLERLDE